MAGRILLITPRFYGIENKIRAALEGSGYEVFWIENKTLTLDYHGSESKLRTLRKIYFKLFSPHVRYLRKALKKSENKKFDILFVINADVVCPYLLRTLKNKNPKLISIIYFWDSFSKFNWIRELKLFDKVVTFDPEDAAKHKIDYLPNFYTRHQFNINNDQNYDLFFVGKFSCERLALLDQIVNISDTVGLNSFIRLWPASRMFLHNRYVYLFLSSLDLKGKWIKKYILNFEAFEGIMKRKYLVNESIGYEEVQRLMHCSNVVLDLPFNSQAGYTHRFIEALANGKKVLTTNCKVRNETFYNPDQIHIFDDKRPEIDSNWIKKIKEFTVDNSVLNLELSSWLKSILNVRIA
jgi:hypothetical protein